MIAPGFITPLVPSEYCKFAGRSSEEIRFPAKIADVPGALDPSTCTDPLVITSPTLDEVEEATLIRQLHVKTEIADCGRRIIQVLPNGHQDRCSRQLNSASAENYKIRNRSLL